MPLNKPLSYACCSHMCTRQCRWFLAAAYTYMLTVALARPKLRIYSNHKCLYNALVQQRGPRHPTCKHYDIADLLCPHWELFPHQPCNRVDPTRLPNSAYFFGFQPKNLAKALPTEDFSSGCCCCCACWDPPWRCCRCMMGLAYDCTSGSADLPLGGLP